ncbi:hypothetical protein [Micromonospora chersina]|uniref:hypothetical protein n=1 Tax=Micromonospora chersina TaxID=47854 RepID=UPI0033C32372
MTGAIDYAMAGPLTRIDAIHKPMLEDLPSDPIEICRVVHDLVIQPSDAKSSGVPAERFAENQHRPVDKLIGAPWPSIQPR